MRHAGPRPDGGVVSRQQGTEGSRPHGRAPLFLIELRGAGSGVQDVERMQAALEHAVARRAATGAAIGWVGGLVVPSDRRFLCLVRAAEEDDVRLARDIAGLHAAEVRPAYQLPSHQHGYPCAEPDEENRPPRKEPS